MQLSIGPVLVLLGSLALAACATTHGTPRPYPVTAAPHAAPRSADAGAVPAGASAAETAESLLGSPYRSGGSDPEGFDCSGFVQYVFARIGVGLPRSVREQWRAGTPVERADIGPGDLVFFAIGGREASHVGIAVDASTFVHAPSARGVVRVERLEAEYWSRRYAGARRVTERRSTTLAADRADPRGASPSPGTGARRDRIR